MLRGKIFRLLPKILYIVAGLAIIILLLFYSLKLIEPSSNPQNIMVTNLTEHQATVSWTTAKPTKGLIVISEDGKFPLLPNFAKKTYKDDGEKNLKRQRFYTTHHITIGDLAPDKTYQYLIYQGWKKKVRGSFTTGPVLTSLAPPSPVYGKVLSADRKTPLIGAIIYFQTDTGKEKSALLSTLSNSEGRWSLDLGNLRSKNLKSSVNLASKSAELVVVEAGSHGKGRAVTLLGKDKPWPDIILK